jgi:uncharacterized RDD family membrane protein YckC
MRNIDMDKASYQGFWIRLLAELADLFILGVPALVINFLLYVYTDLDALIYIVNICLIALIIYLDGTYGGTPGKLLLEMRIVNPDGQTIGIPNAALRYAMKLVSGAILCIGFIMIATSPKKQGLHDRVASTYVVRG